MAKRVEILFLITTYNRPHLLKDLLLDIAELPCTYKVLIFDDCSTVDYSEVEEVIPELHKCEYYRLSKNHGKRQFWKLQNIMYNHVRCEEFDYCIGLLDDMRLVEGFYPLAIDMFEESDADLLNIVMPETMPDFLNSQGAQQFSVNGFTYWDYHWNDLCYITTVDYFESIDYTCPEVPLRRWIRNTKATSGVGSVLTNKFADMGGSIVMVTKSLLKHTGQVSVMNTHRKGYNSLL